MRLRKVIIGSFAVAGAMWIAILIKATWVFPPVVQLGIAVLGIGLGVALLVLLVIKALTEWPKAYAIGKARRAARKREQP